MSVQKSWPDRSEVNGRWRLSSQEPPPGGGWSALTAVPTAMNSTTGTGCSGMIGALILAIGLAVISSSSSSHR